MLNTRLIIILIFLVQSLHASEQPEAKIPYSNLYWFFEVTEKKKNESIVAFVRVLKKGKRELTFTLESANSSKIEKLILINLRREESLTKEEEDYISKGFTYKLLIPVDKKKYSNYFLSHTYPKGLVEITFTLKDIPLQNSK